MFASARTATSCFLSAQYTEYLCRFPLCARSPSIAPHPRDDVALDQLAGIVLLEKMPAIAAMLGRRALAIMHFGFIFLHGTNAVAAALMLLALSMTHI